MKTVSSVKIIPGFVIHNDKVISTKGITELYREFVGDYPKFFKMDSLSKLGFIASEILLKNIQIRNKEDWAVILFNRSGSLVTDRNYEQTINDKENYFPSPSLFVYTLANIVTGEIAIRHKIYGETSFYVAEEYDEEYIENIILTIFLTSSPSHILYGWVEYADEKDYLANLKLIENTTFNNF